jgi:aminoglycoside phosphotransferase (APT) family kinase protein
MQAMDAHQPPPSGAAVSMSMPPAARTALAAFLTAQGLFDPNAAIDTLRVSRLTAGYSNITWRIDGTTMPLVVRQAPPGVQVKGAYDVSREFRVMRALADQWRCVPRPLALCEDEQVLGSRFVAMPFVHGRTFGAAVSVEPAVLRRVAGAFVDTLVELHGLDPAAAGLPVRESEPGFARRQLAGAIQRFGLAQTRSIPMLDEVFAALLRDPPETTELTVTHNDYRLDNVIFDPVQDDLVLAVIDWEMATLGDPWLDVGSALAYWTQADDEPVLVAHSLGPSHLPGAPTRVEWAARYAAAKGVTTPHLPWYAALGLVRLVVVLQQLQARSLRDDGGGQPDPRLLHIEAWIDALIRRAATTLERNGL